jgi:hypothetical protein
MIKIVKYIESETDYKVGFKEDNFIVYGMIGKEVTSGFSRKQIIQKIYEQCYSALEYEKTRETHSISGDGLDGEGFMPNYDFLTIEPVVLSLDEIKANKINEIDLACKLAIISGFHSTAYQGIDKVYTSDIEAQSDILGNAVSSVSKIAGIPGCENDVFYYHAIGETEFYEWEPDLCLQLARDFKAFKETQLFKCKQLEQSVSEAIDIETINNLAW